MSATRPYTVFVREIGGVGTTYIESAYANSAGDARVIVMRRCSEAWGEEAYPLSSLFCLGIADGDVNIIEWDDCL